MGLTGHLPHLIAIIIKDRHPRLPKCLSAYLTAVTSVL